MSKNYIPPYTYEFTPEQKRKAFNLVLKNTIEKKIEWGQGSITEIFKGQARESRMLLYYGLERIGFSIQNKTQYVFFNINKEQAQILQSLIRGKATLRLAQDLKSVESSDDYYLHD